jgi:hypothetical protein
MSILESLAEHLERATFSAFGENKKAVLFGTTNSRDAASQIGQFVEQALGTRIEAVLFLNMSLACAAGFRLSDGRSVFLKIHPGDLEVSELRTVHAVQEELRGQGLPAARLILPATEFRDGKFASIHAFRDRGDPLRAYHKGAINAAAAGLALLIKKGRSSPLLSSVPDIFAKRRNPLTRRAPGTAQPPPLPSADRAAQVMKAVLEDAQSLSGESVIGHGDWASRNLRFSKGEVSSIFDFEAVRRGIEPILVGQGTIQFINEPTGVRDPAYAAAHFVQCYETAAGYRFEGSDAVGLDIGAALEVAKFCRVAVRSDGMSDDDAPRIFANFMQRFRAALGRDYPAKAWI